jgi:hypothetical protein
MKTSVNRLTDRIGQTIMTLVFKGIRTTAVLLLTAVVAAGAAFAPEHVHERDEHHPSAVVHRHFAPHHAGASDHARFDDDDDHVVWLTTAWLQGTVYHGPTLIGTAAIWSGFAPVTAQWSAIVLDDAAPPHGPPRARRSPRGPPFPA